jgi:SAM-dependent methyltransferase
MFEEDGGAAVNAELQRLIHSAADPVVREFLLMADDSIVMVLPFALAIAARLGLADACGPSGRTLPELTKAVGFPVEPLGRLINALASAGFFTLDSSGHFTPTALGAVLSADSPVSMRATLANTDSYSAWLRAADAVLQGPSIVGSAFADEYFEHNERNLKVGAAFNTRMQERGTRLYLDLANLPVWSRARCVLDIGGGTGTVLAAILQVWPHLHGVLFDRAAVIDNAAATSTLDTVRDRCTLVAGDFFKELPHGPDVHLLCSVLHDWTDSRAMDILRASSAALPPGGRVLICEMVLPDVPVPHPARWSDLGMMVLLGGRERTLPEFAELLDCSGLSLTQVLPVGHWSFNLIEACVKR